MNKPNGQLLVAFREEEVVQFAQALKIRKVFFPTLFGCTKYIRTKNIPGRTLTAIQQYNNTLF